MKIVVQKFGGTSVSTEENRKKVIEKVKSAIKDGYSPVVVVSAMGRKGQPYATDTLLSLISDKFKNANKLAQDLLMTCGEIISSVVMSNDLYNAGIDAVPLTGGQAGILTDNNFTDATCIEVKPKKILELVSQGRIPVVTGFQGMTENGYLTTLGRGGSDTTASILGVALKASEIEIYTDVDGIMTADPRVVENANLIDVISYNEVFQLADKGATVIHPKAVEVAMEGNIPILIKNTMSNSKGTLINNFGDKSNDRIMTGIASQKNRIQVSIRAAENQGNVKYKNVLDLLAANKISLDLINIFPNEQIFTINQVDKEILENVLNSASLKYTLIDNCSKVAVIGSRMKGIPGVMAKIIKALSDNNIEVLQTADSHMTIWCLVHSENEKEAINVLHKTFKL
ncbi:MULTISPECIES: aspartate kinase [Clostridium]|jgi:aspartate kinase (EC 2.7.2.4)|uniref:Aspartokinase n=2 Tax=Clostridium beijerinckii TaxID=1520 RepID=A0AAE2RX41_CLOBE|nr:MULTISPECIES: aspartate kinase [Clostridium]ABR33393.1 aspartate kinase [Clostridium beijerinckii NCIMB 8052]AIU00524.1 aspartate kinase I [Clostridium beijerinckii ATCC 35702]MBF7811709.1 aspartate kinase [Clostridium beijerinckii]NOW92784.1 aspartate kinase [Clostridium beijerinckii]NRT25353.1 aspartate kinase [Clostridium beijerinckii]